jgi:hypothetical protein
MDSSPTHNQVMECKVNFHDRSHLKIHEVLQNGENIADTKMKESFTPCIVRLEKSELSFLAKDTDAKPFCCFQPTHMSLEVDRNSQ